MLEAQAAVKSAQTMKFPKTDMIGVPGISQGTKLGRDAIIVLESSKTRNSIIIDGFLVSFSSALAGRARASPRPKRN